MNFQITIITSCGSDPVDTLIFCSAKKVLHIQKLTLEIGVEPIVTRFKRDTDGNIVNTFIPDRPGCMCGDHKIQYEEVSLTQHIIEINSGEYFSSSDS